MVESTFAKVTATTSMTNYERRLARKRAKAAANGNTQPEPIPPQPRRPGLRGVRLAFSDKSPPRRVVRRPVTQQKHIPVRRLPGQEDIPPSDSEPEIDQGVKAPSGSHPQDEPSHDDDDAQSQASTVIEGEEDDASGSEEEGHNMPTKTMDTAKEKSAESLSFGHQGGYPNAASGASTDVAFQSEQVHVPHAAHLVVPHNPQSHLLRQLSGVSQASASPVVPNEVFPDPNTAQPTHIFGAPSGDPSNLLAGLSPEDLAFLNASFPIDATHVPPGCAPGIFDLGTYAACGSFNNFSDQATDFIAPFQPHVTYDNGLGFGKDSSAQVAIAPVAPQPPFATPRKSTGFVATPQTSCAALPEVQFNTFEPTDGSTQSRTGSSGDSDQNQQPGTCPTTSLAPVPAPAPSLASSAPNDPLPACTPARRSVTAPETRADTPPNHLAVSTPTGRSVSQRAASAPGSIFIPRSHASTPSRTTATRATRLPFLPVTPRAFGSNPLSRSVSTPLRPYDRSTPTTNVFQPSGRRNNETASALASRASTPCPSTSHALGMSAPHSPFSLRAAPSIHQSPLVASASVPDNSLDNLGSAGFAEPLETNATWESLDEVDLHGAGNQISQGGADRDHQLRQSPQRVRTPPPLARALNRVVVSNEEVEASDGFIVNRSDVEFQHFGVQLIPPISAAPTTAELAMNKSKEIRALKKGRKSKEQPGKPALRSGDRIGSFLNRDQEFMSIMKAYMVWDFFVRSPWSTDDAALISRAQKFAAASTQLSGDAIVTDSFTQATLRAGPQLRGLPHSLVLMLVKDYYDLREGDIPKISRYLARSRYLYPDNEMHAGDYFNVAIVGTVLAAGMFGTRKRVGILFMDELLRDDDPADIEALLDLVAVPGPGGTVTRPVFTDTSPAASRGAPIASIAYAGILIHHALDRLKSKNLKRDFQEQEYSDLWAQYVRELVRHPNLGALRATFLDVLKEEYCRRCVRKAKPVGNDHAW